MTEFDKVIPPGGVGKVTASVDTSHFKGDVSKAITVTTNDPANSHVSLVIKAKVTVPVDVQPEVVNLDGKAGALGSSTVLITAMEGGPFDIVSAESSDARIQVKVAPVAAQVPGQAPPKPSTPKAGTIASGSTSYQMTVTPAADLGIGRTTGLVKIKTTHPDAASLQVHVNTNVRGNIVVSPERVSMRVGPSQPPGGRVQHVSIKKLEGPPLAITSMAPSIPQIKAELKPVLEGKDYDLAVSWTGDAPTRVQNERITLRTNDPRQQVIDIVVYVSPELQAAAGARAPVQLTPNPTPKVPGSATPPRARDVLGPGTTGPAAARPTPAPPAKKP